MKIIEIIYVPTKNIIPEDIGTYMKNFMESFTNEPEGTLKRFIPSDNIDDAQITYVIVSDNRSETEIIKVIPNVQRT